MNEPRCGRVRGVSIGGTRDRNNVHCLGERGRESTKRLKKLKR